MDKVIIVGGGLGGLLLAILLERASIDYVVLECSPVAKMPLEGGGVISMTSQIQPLLQQLSILPLLKDLTKPVSRVTVLEVLQGSGKQPTVCGVIDSAFSLSRMCWMLDEPLPEPQDSPDVEDLSRMQQDVQEMSYRYRAMPSPLKDTVLGDLFDLTPTGTMLSLPREEASFSTWTHGKIALMGDACHKALPYGGQPMVQAGYDAASLANILYAHSLDPSHHDLEAGLRSYEAARRAEAKHAVESSHQFGQLLNRSGWIGKVLRYLVLNCIPQFLLHSLGDRLNHHRPQASFLPQV
ncbi:hypothetical protein KVV02_004774 [Mortierella alpina]|uniref:FAD-binding domain-containing protein n=1 Tax=Mortierella alpina TaxID=64518 RepID=A0A9P8D0D0_MORAP|nr:hypothetical protein KVV02_004774 [Mortierella alpina]